MPYLEKAAHVTMPVSHASSTGMQWGTYAGAAVGALGFAAFTFFTGGTGLVVLGLAALSGAGTGAGLGSTIGEFVDKGKKTAEGVLDDGVKDCFIGEERFRAVNNDPAINSVGKCHDTPVAEGSLTVFLGKWNFSRKLDQTKCGGQIADGNPRVFIGGDPSMKGVQIKERLTGAAKGAKIFNLGLGIASPGNWFARGAGIVEGAGVLLENENLEKAGSLAGSAEKYVGYAKKAPGVWKDFQNGTGIFKYLN